MNSSADTSDPTWLCGQDRDSRDRQQLADTPFGYLQHRYTQVNDAFKTVGTVVSEKTNLGALQGERGRQTSIE